MRTPAFGSAQIFLQEPGEVVEGTAVAVCLLAGQLNISDT